MVDINQLKKLRENSQASIADCRAAIEESNGDFEKAQEWLKKRGFERANKKEGRETSEGIVEAYVHQNGRVGAMIELLCETDFVLRTDEFKKLAREIAMQVAAMNPENIEKLLEQEYIRDSGKTVASLIKEVIGKLGENITLKGFKRLAVGE